MKIKNTILVFTVIISVVFTMFITANASFADIKSENSALSKAVDVLVSKGITKGMTQTEFGIDELVTREQMAGLIYHMQNGTDAIVDGENTTNFADVDNPEFYSAISWASENGIIKGISETEFNPKAPVTLRDCYTMLVRMFGYEKKAPLSYPQSYISIAENIGLSQNINKSSYTDELTRGDVAIILNNALNKKPHALDGKKILLIGNSYTYYGCTGLSWGYDVEDIETMKLRFEDPGYLYQLCRINGADATVANWSWSGHSLADMFSGNCQNNKGHNGHDHLADLRKYSDMNYDYVVIQPQSRVTDIEEHRGQIKYITDVFREVNPNVEFVYSICPMFYTRADEVDKAYTDVLYSIADEYGLKVANWGKLVADILSGKATVENATQDYTKNTFIVSKSETDGYHPNLLMGYVSTQMIYSIITGEDAFGQDTSFCLDGNLHIWFDPDFIFNKQKYYKYDNISPNDSETKLFGDELTNFPEVFNSQEDMLGIQKLIDEYIKAE